MFSFRLYLAVGFFAFCGLGFAFGDLKLNANNQAERRIAIYSIHTKETLDIVYKRNGRWVPGAKKKINWAMRDHRENKPTNIDPKLIDIIWEIHTELGSREPVHLISGYRSPKTNAMLRKKRGGQAKKSRHMLGKAADIHFPDVPIKRLRYSGLIRQRGGVGYYPTSALPFVHIDTGRVRHWPRMPRYELALLFPNGRTMHRPKRGGPISKRDVRVARAKHKGLARQVAAFFDSRGRSVAPRPVQVASAERSRFRTEVIFADPAGPQNLKPNTAPPARPSKNIQVAALDPAALPDPRLQAQPAPVARAALLPAILEKTPRLAERPSVLAPKPSPADQRKLTELFTLASLIPAAQQLFSQVTGSGSDEGESKGALGVGEQADGVSSGQEPARPELTIASLIAEDELAILEEPKLAARGAGSGGMADAPSGPDGQRIGEENGLPIGRFDWASGWVTAPAYDDEHPEEMFYRPFPLAPLLTATSSPHDPALAQMVHPDVAGTLAFVDDTLAALPMKLRPGRQHAELMWSRHFSGGSPKNASLQGQLSEGEREGDASRSGVARRSVRTSLQ